MIAVTSDQYIFPPRSQDAIPRTDTGFLGEMGWTAQLKYNDSRCIIKYCPNGKVELWNRHAEKFRSYTPPNSLIDELIELRNILGLSKSEISMIDGGLLDQKHAAIKDTIAIWDILVKDGEHLLGTTYNERYDFLTGNHLNTHHKINPETPWILSLNEKTYPLGLKFTKDFLMPKNFPAPYWDTLWDMVNEINAPYTTGKPGDTNYSIKPIIEGLVFKNPEGTLEMGFKQKNNDSWMMRSRVQTGRHLF